MDAINDIDLVEAIDDIDAILGEQEAEENGLNDLFALYRQYFTMVMWDRIFRRLRRTRAARVFWVRRLFHDEHFVQITGFTRTEAQNLLFTIGHRFIRLTKRSWAVQVPEAFIVALRMLRTGKDFWNNGMFVGLSKSTAHRCFWQVVNAVISELSHLISLNLTPQQWKHQATIIHNSYGISHVVGFIDGSYIMIKNIGRRKSWRCRKGFPAINMTLMVDGTGYIRFITCKWPGAMHDSRVYRLSGLAQVVREGWEPFESASIGGDSAYLGTDNFVIARPRDRGINNHNRRFFRAFTKARATIENAIGHLKMSFGILSGTLSGPINCNNRANISKIIKCCCILENFKKRERQQFDEDDDHDFFPPLNQNQSKVEQLIRIFNQQNGHP
uniref:DDE Tnp4 domain-containing protein n=1 Tax=Panagrolaimus sp. PS1159 TaxID=55785 RepID=A0AC35FF54_9BILA